MSLAKCVLHMHRTCYFWAFSQSSDIAVRFSGPDFLKQIGDLAIRGLCSGFSLYTSKICHTSISGLFDIMTLNLCYKLRYTLWTRSTYPFLTYNVLTADLLVTLWPWPLGIWPWTFAVYHQTLYQISAKSNNPRQSYCDLNMSNLGAIGHLGF